MTEHTNADGCKVWLHLLREGGRWSCNELAEALRIDRDIVKEILYRIVETQQVVKFPKIAGGHVRFGIGPQCKVPRGITVQDILDCDLVPFLEAKS